MPQELVKEHKISQTQHDTRWALIDAQSRCWRETETRSNNAAAFVAVFGHQPSQVVLECGRKNAICEKHQNMIENSLMW